jgi:hypothetical protein
MKCGNVFLPSDLLVHAMGEIWGQLERTAQNCDAWRALLNGFMPQEG